MNMIVTAKNDIEETIIGTQAYWIENDLDLRHDFEQMSAILVKYPVRVRICSIN